MGSDFARSRRCSYPRRGGGGGWCPPGGRKSGSSRLLARGLSPPPGSASESFPAESDPTGDTDPQ